MPTLTLSAQDTLFYLQEPPARAGAPTFVFVSSTDTWEAAVAPRLRAQGFGTLSWNFRGQTSSPFAPGTALTDRLIADVLLRLLRETAPQRPILVGLSIGGLYAARAVLAEADLAAGLVLLNTLREIGPRIAWVNDALPALAAYGGINLFLDALLPLPVGPEYAARVRGDRPRLFSRTA